MTAAEEYLEKHGIPNRSTQLCLKYQTDVKDTAQALKDYHKEASKELVEASKLALHFCKRRQMPTEFELEALGVDLSKALENHLK